LLFNIRILIISDSICLVKFFILFIYLFFVIMLFSSKN